MHTINRFAISLTVVATALGLAVVLGAGSALSAPSKATGSAAARTGTSGPRGPRGPRGPQGTPGPQGAQGPQGPAGPSAALATYKDGPVSVQLPQGEVTVASLKIATPGSYVITAKAYGSMDGSSGTLACVLDAHGDSDRMQTQVAGAQPSAFGLEVVHSFADAGSVDLNCSAASSYTISVNWIKIVAIRVGQLTNTAG